jgi:hypothetical protein
MKASIRSLITCAVVFGSLYVGVPIYGHAASAGEPNRVTSATPQAMHELETGWVARGLLDVFGLPAEGEEYAAELQEFFEGLEGSPPERGAVERLCRATLAGFDPDLVSERYLSAITLNLDSLRFVDQGRQKYSVVFIRARMIIGGLVEKGGETLTQAHKRDLVRGIMLVLASSDFSSGTAAVSFIRDGGVIKHLQLTPAEAHRMERFLGRADIRRRLASESATRFGRLFLHRRDLAEKPPLSREEAAELIASIARVREVGVLDQGAWFTIARDVHTALLYPGSGEGRRGGREDLIDYVTQWRDSLPDCHARRWLDHALRQDPEVQPVRVAHAHEVFPK